MNKKELIERIKNLHLYIHNEPYLNKEVVLEFAKHLDEPETGHADEAPRYVKNILARLRELPLHDREVWLKAIMGEFEQDFSRAKWREGYEQGKVEGMIERKKVTIPQFVADWIEKSRLKGWDLLCSMCFTLNDKDKKTIKWLHLGENVNIFARAWLDGYEVEKEKRYSVKVKGICGKHETLNRERHSNEWLFSNSEENRLYKTKFTRKELEQAGFGEVFNSPLFEVEEVE